VIIGSRPPLRPVFRNIVTSESQYGIEFNTLPGSMTGRRREKRHTLESTSTGSIDLDIEITQVVLMRMSLDTGRRVCYEPLGLLYG